MAMVRKCDRCDVIDGVKHYTIRWEGGTGHADLCEKHGQELCAFVTVDTQIKRSVPRKRTGPALKRSTLEDIERQKK